jgi:hypothetical protein
MTSEQKQGTESPKPVTVKKLGRLRALLVDECGYTKEELATVTGLKLSTVNCQLYYHLPVKGYKIEKLAEKKVRFVRG